MNLRRKKPADSLYMLLDTMCNAFGGIILLAVLVVLLTSNEKSQSKTASDTQEMLQRRLALAQDSLRQAEQLQASLQGKAGDEHWKTQVSLLARRGQIQETIAALRESSTQNASELDAATSADPSDRVKNLNAQLAAAETKKLEAQNALAATEENTKRLDARLTGLEKQATDLFNETQRQLRLPKEHETDKRVLYIIARYNRIYTCRNADLSRNETDIQWTSTDTSNIAEPRKGMGIDPVADAARLRAYFHTQSENAVYLGFCVFEDSFPAFIRARQLTIENGLTYGWDPYLNTDGPVSFGQTGSRPKPQ